MIIKQWRIDLDKSICNNILAITCLALKKCFIAIVFITGLPAGWVIFLDVMIFLCIKIFSYTYQDCRLHNWHFMLNNFIEYNECKTIREYKIHVINKDTCQQ